MIVQQVGMIFPLGNEPRSDVWTGGRDELAFPRTGEKAPMVSGLHERHFVRHPGESQTNLVPFVWLFLLLDAKMLCHLLPSERGY
jgi:hypothetical protein